MVRYEWPEIASFPDRIAVAARRGRVLFAWSASGGAVPAAEHLAGIQAARAGQGVTFDPARDVIAGASLARLDRALDDAARTGPPIDAVHLLCHGAALGGSYGLAFDDDSNPGSVAVVDAGRLQQIFAPHAGMVQLVVIAACDSGNSGELGNHLGSVAQMIHRAGIKAVVASRFPLSVPGSVSFAAAFYAALVRDRSSLEQAFIAARDALLCDPAQLDWASVQLYGRRERADGTYPLQWPVPVSASAGAARITPMLARLKDRRALPLALALAGVAAMGVWIAGTDDDGDTLAQHAAADVGDALELSEPSVPTALASVPPNSARKPGRCPGPLVALLRRHFPAARSEGHMVEFTVQVQRDGDAMLKDSRGETSLTEQARERLTLLDRAEVLGLGGGALPCRVAVTWLP